MSPLSRSEMSMPVEKGENMADQHQRFIQPIPTRYDGYLFRSRNEARWAIFYKKLGIPYRYETERYHVNGVTYLIDFEIQEQEEKGTTDCLVEIKPKEPTPEETFKAEWLAQTRGMPVYIFYGDHRLPSEINGAQGILYTVRKAWLSYEGRRLPIALPLSNEIRVLLLQLHEAGFLFQFIYQSQFPSTLQLGPRPQYSKFTSPQKILHLIHSLKEVEEELIVIAKEAVKQYLLEKRFVCEREAEGHGYLTCFAYEDYSSYVDEHGNCTFDNCLQGRQLRHSLKVRQQEEKPCSFLLEFDESRSPEPQYWGQCTKCQAVGIFPGSFKHDIFCEINCREVYVPFYNLEGVTYDTKEEYWATNRKLVDVEAEEIKEAYSAARGEQFNKRT